MLAIMRVLLLFRCCFWFVLASVAFSSPGSWTQFLAERMRWVIALDPGDLAPKVLAMPNVLHLAKKAEDFSVADDYTTSKLPALDGNLGFGVSRRPVSPRPSWLAMAPRLSTTSRRARCARITGPAAVLLSCPLFAAKGWKAAAAAAAVVVS